MYHDVLNAKYMFHVQYLGTQCAKKNCKFWMSSLSNMMEKKKYLVEVRDGS